MQIRVGDLVTPVGVARANILSLPAAFEFAADLMEARLREELKATAARKAARADIESDLALLQQLLALRPGQLASASRVARQGSNSALARPPLPRLPIRRPAPDGSRIDPGGQPGPIPGV